MSMCTRSFWLRLAWQRVLIVFLSVLGFSQAFLGDDEFSLLTPFHLTHQPLKITKDLTENVTLRCAHTAEGTSQIQTVRAINIKKKEISGWRLIAEDRDNESPETLENGVSVSGHVIVHDTRATFLEVTWPVATDDTFGVYLCEVTGIDSSGLNKVESTAQVKVSQDERNVTALDILALLRKTQARFDGKVAEQSRRIDNLDTVLGSMNTTLVSIDTKLNSGIDKKSDNGQSSRDLVSLSLFVKSLGKTVTTLSDDVARLRKSGNGLSGEPLKKWPAGNYALLQPKTGCPRDLAFIGRPESYLRLHTERIDNRDAHTAALAPGTRISMLGLNLFTLRFCEANGVSSTAKWPLGSYCINKLHEQKCPDGFEDGFVHLDNEDSAKFDDYAGNVVRQMHSLNPTVLFCCTRSGSSSSPVALPTRSPFLLYRRGGVCQQVLSMSVSEEMVSIDTEDKINLDFRTGSHPDVDIQQGSTTRIHLCHYLPKNW